MPAKVREALQDAMEIAVQNVPRIEGRVYVCPDVSGSMHSPVTGVRKGATTAVRCIDVAALVAAAVLRKNPQAEVIPFESDVVRVRLNPRDSVMTNAQRLASLPCGGTNCSAPLRYLNRRKADGDLVIYVSDNESWIDAPHYGRFGGGATETMRQWAEFKRRSPAAKMICIDIQPYGHTPGARAPGYRQRRRLQRPGLQPDRRSGRRRHAAGPLGPPDCRHAIVMTGERGGRRRSMRRPPRDRKHEQTQAECRWDYIYPCTRLNNPLSASFLKHERSSGECRWEYMVKSGFESPAAQAASLANPCRRAVLKTARRIRSKHATNAGGTTCLKSTRLRVRVPSPRLAADFGRGVAQR